LTEMQEFLRTEAPPCSSGVTSVMSLMISGRFIFSPVRCPTKIYIFLVQVSVRQCPFSYLKEVSGQPCRRFPEEYQIHRSPRIFHVRPNILRRALEVKSSYP